MFDIPDLTVTRIDRDNATAMRELQALLERCSDYYELVEGTPARPTAATDEFDLPFEFSRDDIFILGFREGDDLIAEMSLLRNYPKPTEWWVALFVVQPESRSRGIGARICEATFNWIASIGGTEIVLDVDDENPRGQRFWQSLGLIETSRRDHKATTGMQRRMIIMRRALTPTR
jgi:ribosomal protein S18 acetylase RimI-like enzyme